MPANAAVRLIKSGLAILCAAAIAAVTLSSIGRAQSLAKPSASESDRPDPTTLSTDPIDLGKDQFMCCRAVLYDCRAKVAWGLRNNLRGNADWQRCLDACVRNLRKFGC